MSFLNKMSQRGDQVVASKADEWDGLLEKLQADLHRADDFLQRQGKALEEEMGINLPAVKAGLKIMVETLKQLPRS